MQKDWLLMLPPLNILMLVNLIRLEMSDLLSRHRGTYYGFGEHQDKALCVNQMEITLTLFLQTIISICCIKIKSLKMRIYIYKIYETVSVAIATLITRNCRLNYNFAELPASPIIAAIIMHDIVHVFGVSRRCLGLLLLCYCSALV